MERLHCDFNCLSRDLLGDIMARLDGSTLAAAACTCCNFRDIARDQSLWKRLCHTTWPSTAIKEAQQLFSSSTIDSFDRFYADSYPLLSHEKVANNIPIQTHTTLSDFVSFIDVYYHDKCILSRVIDDIPRALDAYKDDEQTDLRRWLFRCSFKLVVLDADRAEDTAQSAYDEYGYDQILAPHFMSPVQLGKSSDHCKELAEGFQLSWVLLDKKRGRAVNLSGWKPLLVEKIWVTDDDYVIHFGCIIPVEESLLPHKLAKCIILVRCKLSGKEGSLKWKEISMHFEDSRGAHINSGKSLIIMNRALYCLRTINRQKFEKSYKKFEEHKHEMIQRRKLKEAIADWFCISFELAIFLTLGYYLCQKKTLGYYSLSHQN